MHTTDTPTDKSNKAGYMSSLVRKNDKLYITEEFISTYIAGSPDFENDAKVTEAAIIKNDKEITLKNIYSDVRNISKRCKTSPADAEANIASGDTPKSLPMGYGTVAQYIKNSTKQSENEIITDLLMQ